MTVPLVPGRSGEPGWTVPTARSLAASSRTAPIATPAPTPMMTQVDKAGPALSILPRTTPRPAPIVMPAAVLNGAKPGVEPGPVTGRRRRAVAGLLKTPRHTVDAQMPGGRSPAALDERGGAVGADMWQPCADPAHRARDKGPVRLGRRGARTFGGSRGRIGASLEPPGLARTLAPVRVAVAGAP